jgi:hypothetical protein
MKHLPPSPNFKHWIFEKRHVKAEQQGKTLYQANSYYLLRTCNLSLVPTPTTYNILIHFNVIVKRRQGRSTYWSITS